MAGSAILLNLLEIFERSALEVIDSGLLEGILLEGIEKSIEHRCGGQRAKDIE